jgi:transposase-like protein
MEIISGVERRRRWRIEDKLRIVAEVETPGACFAAVARRHDVSRGLLWSWRRDVRRGAMGVPVPPEPVFLPIRVSDLRPVAPAPAAAASTAPSARDTRIEIPLSDGTGLRVGAEVGVAALRRVLSALRR